MAATATRLYQQDVHADALPDVAGVDQRSDAPRSPIDGGPALDVEDYARLLALVLDRQGVAADAQASLSFVDAEEIAGLKARHLDGDGSPTDVLSFPIDGLDADPGMPWLVGDVVVCPQVAAEQAPDHAGTFDDEMALLVVHAGLHLTGWDHATDADRTAMWQRERELMSELHGAPASDPWSGDLDGAADS